MADPTLKHWHVDANRELFEKHKKMQTLVAALGMIYPGKLDGAPGKMEHAAAFVQNDQDLYQSDIARYANLIDDVAIVTTELAPTSGLTQMLEELRHETVGYITGEVHDPATDYPTKEALESVAKFLEPLLRKPYLRKDPNGVELLPLETVRVRIARYLVQIPKEYWPED